MKNVLLCLLLATIATSAHSADGIVNGSLWLRPNASAGAKALLERNVLTLQADLVDSIVKPPSTRVCRDADCPIRIKDVTYTTVSDSSGPSTFCTMKIDPEVLIVTRSKVTVTWIIDVADHQFKDKNDIEFDRVSPGLVAASAKELKLSLDLSGIERHKYNIIARKANPAEGCKVDPLIVNTG